MCRFFHKKKLAAQAIPSEVSATERLIRFIMSPLHFDKKGVLRSNAFNPTFDSNEISVTRLDYSSVEECKRLAHKMDCRDEAGKKGRSYSGFCLLNKAIAIACGAKDVVWSPTEDNPAHADILLEEVRVRTDGPIPTKIQMVADGLKEKSIYFKDPDPQRREWTGAPIQF